MKYTKEERLDIGRMIYTHELTRQEAMDRFHLAKSTADRCVTEYKIENGIPFSNSTAYKGPVSDLEAYMAMSKEELITELIKAKANELRAKKGYEVKGDGANKEFVSLNNRNSKS